MTSSHLPPKLDKPITLSNAYVGGLGKFEKSRLGSITRSLKSEVSEG